MDCRISEEKIEFPAKWIVKLVRKKTMCLKKWIVKLVRENKLTIGMINGLWN